MKKEIRFVDTTIRDGHQSLWAERMTTGMMLPVAERLDRAGFAAIELMSGSHFKKGVRELGENPWERIGLMAARMPNTPLWVNVGGIDTFGHDPESLYRLLLDRLVARGVRQMRISAHWNDLDEWRERKDWSEASGLDCILNIIYSISPRHTDAYYAERTRQAASLKPYRLCLKDPGGLLTPDRMRTLVPIVLKNSGGIPVELHSHCTTGLGPMCAVEAIKLGIRIINTAIPPLADDASLPSVFNVARNARVMGYKPLIDEAMLLPVSRHFEIVAKREGFPIGRPAPYDETQYQHQVPGGMISNLRHQLAKVGMADRVEAALKESIVVRAELGYPIMVTPFSQFVGSQAAINVIVGARYKEVTDQVIRYALGEFGREAIDNMDANVRDRILDRPRAKELAKQAFTQPSLDEIRKTHGGPGVSDEDLILRWIVSAEEIAKVKAAGPIEEYFTGDTSLVSLVADMTSRGDTRLIRVKGKDFALTLER